MMKITKNIKLEEAIQKSGYLKRWLAARLGVKDYIFSRYMNGDLEVPKEHQKALSKILNTPIKDLF